MSGFAAATTRAARIDNMQSAKRALRSGTSIGQRIQSREQRADEWVQFFHRKTAQGGDVLSYLPDALGELEQRAVDAARSEVLALKAELLKALGDK